MMPPIIKREPPAVAMTGYGFYDFDRQGTRWEMVYMVDLQAIDIMEIDGFDVFLFGDQHGDWWIGALWDEHIEPFGIRGPYKDGEEAYIMMKLLGSK